MEPSANKDRHTGTPSTNQCLSEPAAETRKPLSHAVTSADYELRLAAGQIMYDLIQPGVLLSRRVQSINLIGPNANTRESVLDLNWDAIDAVVDNIERHPLHIDLDVLPLILLPKGVYYSLSVHDETGALTQVANRDIDSNIGQGLLVAIAQSASLTMPSTTIWDLLWLIAYRFPRSDHLVRDQSRHVAALGKGLSGADNEWWTIACRSNDWVDWVCRLETHFFLTCKSSTGSASSSGSPLNIISVSLTESLASHGYHEATFDRGLNAQASPGKRIAIMLPDLGRATSEHVRIMSPSGAFLAEPSLQQPAYRGVLSWRVRATRMQASFYARKTDSPSDAFILATLWPEPRDLVTPLHLYSNYASIFLWLYFIGQIFFDVLSPDRGLLGAIVPFALFLPAVLIPVIFRVDRDQLAWDMLRPWRELAFLSVAPLWIAVMIGFIHAEDGLWSWLVDVIIFVCAVIQTVLTYFVGKGARFIHKMAKTVNDSSSLPAKGAKVVASS